jgi:DNA-directed RNA polymerase subunit RPC12/RpoP
MHHKDVAPSLLPSFLLPCPHCGHRMTITVVAPTRFPNGAESNDLEDVTHGCLQCGTKLTRTIRPLSGDVREIAPRI